MWSVLFKSQVKASDINRTRGWEGLVWNIFVPLQELKHGSSSPRSGPYNDWAYAILSISQYQSSLSKSLFYSWIHKNILNFTIHIYQRLLSLTFHTVSCIFSKVISSGKSLWHVQVLSFKSFSLYYDAKQNYILIMVQFTILKSFSNKEITTVSKFVWYNLKVLYHCYAFNQLTKKLNMESMYMSLVQLSYLQFLP